MVRRGDFCTVISTAYFAAYLEGLNRERGLESEEKNELLLLEIRFLLFQVPSVLSYLHLSWALCIISSRC